MNDGVKAPNSENLCRAAALWSAGEVRPAEFWHSEGREWEKKRAVRNLPQLSQSRVVMIAIMMMIEMMNQKASRAQATARSLAHLLFLAIRTPARSVPLLWHWHCGNFLSLLVANQILCVAYKTGRGQEGKPVWNWFSWLMFARTFVRAMHKHASFVWIYGYFKPHTHGLELEKTHVWNAV